jgi:polyhydroxybutyrate depolymerase
VSPRVTVIALAVGLAVLGACSSDDVGETQPSTGQTTSAPRPPSTVAHASGPSSGCGVAAAVEPGPTDLRLTSGGVERSYLLIVPDDYDGTTPYPVVLGLHALTVDYRIVPALSGFADMAATYDFVGVAPSGLLGPGGAPYWNATAAAENQDVAFLSDLLDHVERTLCVDTGRVFSIGMSNGAQTSSLLACRLPARISAIGPIAGVEFNEPCDGAPVPIMAFHGVEDPVVPYEGGGLNSVTIADQNLYMGDLPDGVTTPTGVDDSMRRWAEHNGCGPDFSEERTSPEVRRRTWPECDAPTVLYVVDNGGHAWPGKPQPAFEASFGHGTTEIDATSLLFAFFFDAEH